MWALSRLGHLGRDDADELLKTVGTAAISIALLALLFGFVLSYRG